MTAVAQVGRGAPSGAPCPQTMAELVARLRAMCVNGMSYDAVAEQALSWPLPAELLRQVTKRGLASIAQVAMYAISSRPTGPTARLAVRNRLTSTAVPFPVLLTVTFDTAGGGRTISALRASPRDWEAEQGRQASREATAARKDHACTVVRAALKRHKATCIERLSHAEQERLAEVVRDGWQRRDGDDE